MGAPPTAHGHLNTSAGSVEHLDVGGRTPRRSLESFRTRAQGDDRRQSGALDQGGLVAG